MANDNDPVAGGAGDKARANIPSVEESEQRLSDLRQDAVGRNDDKADSDDKAGDAEREEEEQEESVGFEDLLESLIDDKHRTRRREQRRAYENAIRNLAVPIGTNQQNIFLQVPGTAEDVALGREIPDDYLAQVQRLFVRPGGYERAWSQLERQGLLILSGPRGFGRSFTSYHLLDAGCVGGVRQIGEQDLYRLEEEPAEDTGFICDGLTPGFFDTYDAHRLGALATRLRQTGCRAILVADQADDEWPPGIEGLVSRLERPPDAGEVIRKILVTDANDADTAKLVALLEDPEAQAVLHSFAQGWSSVADVSDFARDLLSVHRRELALKTACARADRSERALGDWFNELGTPEEKAFAIALAALNRQPLPAISDAARTLGSAIRHAERPDKPPPVHVFQHTTRHLLRVVGAIRYPSSDSTEYGSYPVEAAEARQTDYPRRLLALVWREYPELQPLLVTWLGELSLNGRSPQIRTQASTAVGFLAELDFAGIYQQVLDPWGRGYSDEKREAVAAAMRVSALNPDLREQVWTLLDQWGDPPDLRRADETAVRGESLPRAERPAVHLRRRQLAVAAALGTSVGSTNLPEALRILGRQAESPNNQVKKEVSTAITGLFSTADPAGMTRVLATLAEWAVCGHHEKMRAGLVAFVQILIDLDAEEIEAGQSTPPRILLAAASSPELLESTAGLWRRALNTIGLEVPAMKALRQWVEAAETAPETRVPLCRLVSIIPRTPRDQRVLEFYLGRWRHLPECTETADLLRNALTGKEADSHAHV